MYEYAPVLTRLTTVLLAAVSAIFVVGVSAKPSTAQTNPGQNAAEQLPASTDVGAICNGTSPIEAGQLVKVLGTVVISPDLCDLRGRTITDNGVGVKVPSPGEGLGVASVGTGVGSGQEFAVETDKDGAVRLLFVGPGVANRPNDRSTPQYTTASSPNACRDTAYNQNVKESSLHRWRYNSSTTPRYLSGRALNAIRAGVNNILKGSTNCRGFGNRRYGPRAQYVGYTSHRAPMRGTTCTGRTDGINTRDFGYIDGNRISGYDTLAVTCYRYYAIPREVYEADIRFDNANSFTLNPSSCRGNRWDLIGLATHEWGHVFGLGHVPERTHGRLTMSPLLDGTCEGRERTLGRGDYFGLYGLYN